MLHCNYWSLQVISIDHFKKHDLILPFLFAFSITVFKVSIGKRGNGIISFGTRNKWWLHVSSCVWPGIQDILVSSSDSSCDFSHSLPIFCCCFFFFCFTDNHLWFYSDKKSSWQQNYKDNLIVQSAKLHNMTIAWNISIHMVFNY